MILYFGARRATRDIDVLVLRGDVSELREAVRAVARERGLPRDWLSDAAKGFADILPPDFYHRLAPLEFNFRHLRVYALGRPEQVAMKIVALREQDLEDLELLLPQLSEEEKEVVIRIMHHVSRFRPDWAQKMQYFLEEQGWEIR
jgi:alkanesulfonate monooxygenase SsuD/methylene tetrahydromethanopterin reductase-like flavin-dependent oxidoreductase (luciferase family)